MNSFDPPLRALILDMDGVLWRANEPIGSLEETFNRILSLGYKFVMATNNSAMSPQMYVEKLANFKVKVSPGQVINSAMSVTYALCERFPSGGPVYIVGEAGLEQVLNQSGFFQETSGSVLAVVAGLDRKITYQKLTRATLLIRSGVPFYGTNPDKTYPSPDGLIPGAGALLAAIETASGAAPIIGGKPGRFMFDLALERLGTTAAETLSIGDRLDTDVLGAQQAGIRTALVLSGITSLQEAQAWKPAPDWVCEDLPALAARLAPVPIADAGLESRPLPP